MGKRIPVVGDFYKQGNGGLCQVRELALNSKDSKPMVVYQEMYSPFGIFVMTLDDFLSCNVSVQGNEFGDNESFTQVKEDFEVSDDDFRSALLSGKLERNIHGKISEEEIAQKGFMELLDAGNCHDKIEILVALKPYLTKRMLENFAVTLDLVLNEGEEEEYYNAILSCLQTMEKYEGGHLRGK